MTKILKDKKPTKKGSIKDNDSDWLIGWGSTGELELEEIKPKKVKLASYNSPGLTKTTPLDTNNESSNLELNNHSNSTNGVTAIVVVMKSGPKFHSKNKCPKPSKKKFRKI